MPFRLLALSLLLAACTRTQSQTTEPATPTSPAETAPAATEETPPTTAVREPPPKDEPPEPPPPPTITPESRWAGWELPLAGATLTGLTDEEPDQGGADFIHDSGDVTSVMKGYRKHFEGLGYRQCETARSGNSQIINLCRDRKPDCATVTVTVGAGDAGLISANLYYVELECR